MLRRLHPEQPESFAFTPANLDWAKAQIAKYPEGRQASAVIPLLWRAQEQEGWLSRPALEYVADMLGMATIRVLEVATFYFMFQLQPVGSVAHVQVCGTTSCMICGAEDLIGVCREKIAANPHELSSDGKFSWEEVECLGACSNAPMAQIGKDYYEDLTAEGFSELLDAFARGEVPRPGPQNGRFASEPKAGLTSLTSVDDRVDANASVTLALTLGDTIARITGEKPDTEIAPTESRDKGPEPDRSEYSDTSGEVEPQRPPALDPPEGGEADDLKLIKWLGPEVETALNEVGIYHFRQIGEWTPQHAVWVEQNVEGVGQRVTQNGWIEQARILAGQEDANPAGSNVIESNSVSEEGQNSGEGGETEFTRQVDKGDDY